MYSRKFSQIIVIVTAIVCCAEDDKQRVLQNKQGLSDSTYLQRFSKRSHVVRKKEQDAAGLNHIRKRALEAATTQLFHTATKAFNLDDDCCCCDDGSSETLSPGSTPSTTASTNPTLNLGVTPSKNPTQYPTQYPTQNPTQNPTFTEKKIIASDGVDSDKFAYSCSISEDLAVFGTYKQKGLGAYLFNLDGTEIQKLTLEDVEDSDYFGASVSMDEKVVVGSFRSDYVPVFSRDGILERTITCNGGCSQLGNALATLGNLIVMNGFQNLIWKLFIYSTEDGQLLKTLEQGSDTIYGVAMSEQFIVSTTETKTSIYYNTPPDFPQKTEINQGGRKVAVAGEILVIGDPFANTYEGAAYLYDTDGAIVTALDRQDASSGSGFGWSVAFTDDKVLVGVWGDNDNGSNSGSVFIYSAVTGEFVEKLVATDGEVDDHFGWSVCASDSYYMVGAFGDDDFTGAAYLFRS